MLAAVYQSCGQRQMHHYPHGMQAVHSGADLQSAAAAVMGYDQVTMKGKAISIAPVPGVASAQLQALLDTVLPAKDGAQQAAPAEGATAVSQALDTVRRMVQIRLHLLPALAKGNSGCGGRLRYCQGFRLLPIA